MECHVSMDRPYRFPLHVGLLCVNILFTIDSLREGQQQATKLVSYLHRKFSAMSDSADRGGRALYHNFRSLVLHDQMKWLGLRWTLLSACQWSPANNWQPWILPARSHRSKCVWNSKTSAIAPFTSSSLTKRDSTLSKYRSSRRDLKSVGLYKEQRYPIVLTSMITSLVYIFVVRCQCPRLQTPPRTGTILLASSKLAQTIPSTSYHPSHKRNKLLLPPSTNCPSQPTAHHLSNPLSRPFEISRTTESCNCCQSFVSLAMLIIRILKAFPTSNLMRFYIWNFVLIVMSYCG